MTPDIEPPETLVESYEDPAEEHEKDHVLYETNEVLSVLRDHLQEASDEMARLKELAAANQALSTVAERYDDPASVIDHTEGSVGDIAAAAQIKKEKILSTVLVLTRKYHNEQNKQELKAKLDRAGKSSSDDLYTLEEGIAFDRYLETVEKIVKLVSEDYVTDPSYVFVFRDGTQVRVEEGDHLSRTVLYTAIESAADSQVRNEIVSLEAATDIDAISADEWEDQYRELSHGPQARPWGLDVVLDEYQKDAWNTCITHLVEEKQIKQESGGPCTDAWDDLRGRIQHNRAAEDKQSVVSHGGDGVFYDDDNQELWVPTSMVAAAVEEYATTRPQFAYELYERGVTSDELSGRKVSKAEGDVSPPTRFWRLDYLHGDVPEPAAIVDSFDDLNDAFGSVDAAADGGTTEFGGDE